MLFGTLPKDEMYKMMLKNNNHYNAEVQDLDYKCL